MHFLIYLILKKAFCEMLLESGELSKAVLLGKKQNEILSNSYDLGIK